MNVRVKCDIADIKKAINNLAPHVKESRNELVKQAARGFVRNIVNVTPPGGVEKSEGGGLQAVTGTSAKKQGEAAILRDLARIMMAVRSNAKRRTGGAMEDPVAIHKRLRNSRTGRVNPGNLQSPYPVDRAQFNALKKKLLARVGLLASGWNAAAGKLGVRLPAWIARHGSGGGTIHFSNERGRCRIEITNAIKYVGYVKDLERRMQWSVQAQANAMQRKADFLLKKAVKKAGFL